MSTRKITSAFVALSLATASSAMAGTVTLYNYNVVATGNYTSNSHVDGKAVVNNLSGNNAEFGSHPGDYTGDSLAIAGTATGSAKTFKGTLHHDKSLSNISIQANGGSNVAPLNDLVASAALADLSAQMNQQSTAFAALEKTAGTFQGIKPNSNSNYHFDAPDGATGQVVFKVAASALSNQTFAFNLKSASSFIIDIIADGISDTIFNTKFTTDPSQRDAVAKKVIWNFVDTTTITPADAWWGTILGPKTTLNASKNIDGGVYVSNISQTAEIHSYLFTGAPAISTPPSERPVPGVPLPAAATAGMTLGCMGVLRRRR